MIHSWNFTDSSCSALLKTTKIWLCEDCQDVLLKYIHPIVLPSFFNTNSLAFISISYQTNKSPESGTFHQIYK